MIDLDLKTKNGHYKRTGILGTGSVSGPTGENCVVISIDDIRNKMSTTVSLSLTESLNDFRCIVRTRTTKYGH